MFHCMFFEFVLKKKNFPPLHFREEELKIKIEENVLFEMALRDCAGNKKKLYGGFNCNTQSFKRR